jgi:hypothetical protein
LALSSTSQKLALSVAWGGVGRAKVSAPREPCGRDGDRASGPAGSQECKRSRGDDL